MVIPEELRQGDILKVEHIKHPVLIVSNNFFNSSGEIIGCPIYADSTEGPLHIPVITNDFQGYVQCEKLALLDLTVRGHKKTGQLTLADTINITDAVQGIFDYI